MFGLIVYLFNPPAHNIPWAFFICASALLAGYGAYKGVKPSQQAERDVKAAQYDRLWVCLRCGNIAEKEEFAQDA